MLVGGLAVGAWGYPRATKDVNFLVGDEAYEHHAGGLVTMKPGVPIQVGGVAIDFLSPQSGEAQMERALRRLDAVEGEVPVAPLDVLIHRQSGMKRNHGDWSERSSGADSPFATASRRLPGGGGRRGQRVRAETGQARVVAEIQRRVDAWRGFTLGRAAEPYPQQAPRYQPVAEGDRSVSDTTMHLLQHWFRHEPHLLRRGRGTLCCKPRRREFGRP